MASWETNDTDTVQSNPIIIIIIQGRQLSFILFDGSGKGTGKWIGASGPKNVKNHCPTLKCMVTVVICNK